jgi:hypothetical protein
MNGADKRNEIERLLRQGRPAKPSAELKRRVLDAAGEAWVAQPSPVLWHIAVRRLAVSAAAAVLIVVFVDAWSDLIVARSQTHRPVAVARASDENLWADTEPDIPYGSPLGHMVVARWSAPGDADTLLDHIRGLQDALSQIGIEE